MPCLNELKQNDIRRNCQIRSIVQIRKFHIHSDHKAITTGNGLRVWQAHQRGSDIKSRVAEAKYQGRCTVVM
eukprot:scaffold28367_cov16-Prasinocladus_malaysianus.AAC.2